jgi:ATP/ADP translocase
MSTFLLGFCLGGLAIIGSIFACWLFTIIQSGILRRWGWFNLSLITGLAPVIVWVVWLVVIFNSIEQPASTEEQALAYVALAFSLGWWITILLFGLIGPKTRLQ